MQERISYAQVMKRLREKARPDQLEAMAKYGMTVEKRLGLAIPELRKIAKETGQDHELALELWRAGIADAMILASMVDIPELVTEAQMDAWVKDFNSWDVCDQVCMNLFEKTTFAWEKIILWSRRDELFVKRAAFALIACLAWHDKNAVDDQFINLMPVIQEGARDERPMVKKAVSWALRNMGKRNVNLNASALKAAEEIRLIGSKSAKWISTDVGRDLTGEIALRRLKKMD